METIPGGAYLNGDRWVDANGKPLTGEQIAQAEQLHADQQAQRDADNLAILEAQARNDPLARSLAHALAHALRPQPPVAPPPAQERQSTLTQAPAPIDPAQRRILVDSVGSEVADKLAQAGYGGADDVARATDEQLLAIEGIGPGTLRKLRQARG